MRRRGWRRDGVVVVPNGVDTDRFTPGPADPRLRARLGLDGAFVVGWAGSFRSFHGLDTLLEAAAIAGRDIDDLHLLLVGDGLARPRSRPALAELGVRAVFTGTVPFTDIPDYMRAMDVATVLADPAQPFHYSPVKLREYQACGRAVVASAVGEMQRELRDGETAAMVDAGDATGARGHLRAVGTRSGADRPVGDCGAGRRGGHGLVGDPLRRGGADARPRRRAPARLTSRPSGLVSSRARGGGRCRRPRPCGRDDRGRRPRYRAPPWRPSRHGRSDSRVTARAASLATERAARPRRTRRVRYPGTGVPSGRWV